MGGQEPGRSLGEGLEVSWNRDLASSTGSDRIRLVDVGGAGGLSARWAGVGPSLLPVLFEPNPAQAAELRARMTAEYPSALVLETGLSNVTGPHTLNIAAYWGCTSMREPNKEVLANYRIGGAFRVVDRASVACTRYDALHATGQVPPPDAIKVDVQGFEYEVLQGFGGLLQDCLGIEIETHLYPLYKGQKLLGDLIAFLADFDFVLRRLQPVPSFDGDVVELDAWFTKKASTWRGLDAARKAKFRTLCDVWDLVDYSRINPAAEHNHIDPK